MESQSFKNRVADVASQQSLMYKSIFVDYEYLLCSETFKRQDYYIISAKPDNYKHLIGVHSYMSANNFYNKCISGQLTDSDFDFCVVGRSEKSIQGSVRRKIKSLPYLMSIFDHKIYVQEDYIKNNIRCSFAASDCNITIGFSGGEKSRPNTLLYGNILDRNTFGVVDLVMRRKSGDSLFSEIVIGNTDLISKYKNKIEHVVSSELISDASQLICV